MEFYVQRLKSVRMKCQTAEVNLWHELFATFYTIPSNQSNIIFNGKMHWADLMSFLLEIQNLKN